MDQQQPTPPAVQTSSSELPTYQQEASIYTSPAAFEQIQRVAKVFSLSKLVPKDYQQNLPDCIVALEMANRIGIHPMMFMQHSQVVHGKPGIDGQLAISLVNTRGGFQHKLRFRYHPEDEAKRRVLKNIDELGCTCWTTDRNGEVLEVSLNIAEVKKWGWWDKPGSPWQKMPEQMLAYRTGLFFARRYCPEVLCGLRTTDELQDIVEVSPAVGGEAAGLNAQLKVTAKAAPQTPRDNEEDEINI